VQSLETLRVDRRDGVVTVTLNRPEVLNAANEVMWGELVDVFDEVAGRDEDRVLVLTGAGRAFCSGADLSAPAADGLRRSSALGRMRRVGDAARNLIRLPKPTLAKVNGVAAGAGANLALACDLVVASEDARFCEIFARRGLSVDFAGSWILPRRVGLHRAKELVLLAEMVPATEAAAIGLINRAVPAAELDAFVGDWAARLAAGPPAALSLSKLLLNDGADATLDAALEAEGAAQAYNFSTEDVREAMAAWQERRDPVFRGR
jgi:enoyl-CoA hydratase/carnithine racemase